MLFDLAHFRYSLFAAITEQGDFFLTRLKENANPRLWRPIGATGAGRLQSME